MNRSICMSLGAAIAASALSGCFFGLLDVQRDRSIPPAPVVDASAKVVRPAPALARRSEPARSATTPIAAPVAVAPAVQARAVTPPPSNVVLFGVDAYQPDPAFDASLRAHADQLKADPKLHLVLKGHGDARGTVHYKRALAAKRAEMVAKALVGFGVAEHQLTQVIGDDDDPNSTEVRRVELIYR